MKIHNLKLLMPLALTMLLTGCPIDGDNGSDGSDGTVGLSGINCWDLNGNRINDDDEDKNNDGLWDADDCGSQNTISQNTDAVLNHQHFCEAFAALGQYPSSCPSMSHTPPTGTLTQQTRTTWYDDGLGNGWSCNQPPPNSGPVSIQPKADGYYWVVEGGFIAAEATFAVEDEINDARCFNLCDLDPDCIASLASLKSSPSVYACNTFHHSDTVSPWSQRCGNSGEECINKQVPAVYWSARCP